MARMEQARAGHFITTQAKQCLMVQEDCKYMASRRKSTKFSWDAAAFPHRNANTTEHIVDQCHINDLTWLLVRK